MWEASLPSSTAISKLNTSQKSLILFWAASSWAACRGGHSLSSPQHQRAELPAVLVGFIDGCTAGHFLLFALLIGSVCLFCRCRVTWAEVTVQFSSILHSLPANPTWVHSTPNKVNAKFFNWVNFLSSHPWCKDRDREVGKHCSNINSPQVQHPQLILQSTPWDKIEFKSSRNNNLTIGFDPALITFQRLHAHRPRQAVAAQISFGAGLNSNKQCLNLF